MSSYELALEYEELKFRIDVSIFRIVFEPGPRSEPKLISKPKPLSEWRLDRKPKIKTETKTKNRTNTEPNRLISSSSVFIFPKCLLVFFNFQPEPN